MLLVGGIVLASNEVEWGVIGVPVGIVVAVVGALIGSVGSRIVSPKKIDNEYVWLKGVHPDVLAMFPDWPRA